VERIALGRLCRSALDCKIAQLEAKCNNLEQENAKLKEANEDVQSRLDDYRQDYARS
jgi:cell division protein FtsB